MSFVRTRWRLMLWAVALVVALVLPQLMSSYQMTIAINALIFALFAVGLNVILGHAGLPSLGHAAFFGTGAYAVALLARAGITHPLVVVLVGVGAAVILALVLGPILLRTRAEYFLMATIAVCEVMRNIATNWRNVTKGDDGLYGTTPPPFLGLDLSDQYTLYYVALVVLGVALIGVTIVMRSPFGYAVRALRDNTSRISMLGVRPFTVELSALVLSAAVSALAGVMFAYANGFVSPGVLSVETSGRALLMVALGGPATVAGPVIGAVVIEAIRGIGSSYTDRWVLILGVVYVLIAANVQGRIGDRMRKSFGFLDRGRKGSGLATPMDTHRGGGDETPPSRESERVLPVGGAEP